MASVNKVILVGNLGKDPESRHAPSGDMICNITVATTDSWRDKATGEKRENTEWHRVVFWDKLAEIASQYLRKGSQVYIEGRLQTRKWQDQNGQDRYTTEIRAEQMQMLGRREGMGGGASAGGDDFGNGGGFGGGYGGDQGGGGYGQQRPAQQRAPAPAAQPQTPFDSGFGDEDIPF